jgi:hypothetical protein
MSNIRVRVLRSFMIAGGQVAVVGEEVDVPASVAGEALRTHKAELVRAQDARALIAAVDKEAAVVRSLGAAPRQPFTFGGV